MLPRPALCTVGGCLSSISWQTRSPPADGTTWSFTWVSSGWDEGLLIYQGELIGTTLRPDAVAPVDATESWQRLGPGLISDLTAVSIPFEGDVSPTTVILAGADGREAVITLGETDQAGRFCRNPTNIAVFFSVADARAAGAVA